MAREGRAVGSRSWIPKDLQGISINSSNPFVFSLCSEQTAQLKTRGWPWLLSQGWCGCKTSSDLWEKPSPWGQACLSGPKPDGFWTRTFHILQAHFSLPRLGAWGSRSTPHGEMGRISESRTRITCLPGQMPIHKLAMFFLDPLVGFTPRDPKLCGLVCISEVLRCWAQQWAQLPASH